jgi:cytoskeletal protein CcmA (bactofilin family)
MFMRPARRGAETRDSGRKVQKVASLMADDLVFEGNLAGDGDVHLDGLIRGDVRLQRLTVGARGCVEGAITAEAVEVHGRVVGSITARHVRLYGGAQVVGDITHEELTVEAGAMFQGRSLRPTSSATPFGAGPGAPAAQALAAPAGTATEVAPLALSTAAAD